MKPAEMAEKLLALAAGSCTQQFGEAGYSCREYDALALYGSQCDRCEACDQIAKIREPWKSRAVGMEQTLEHIGGIVRKILAGE